MTEALRVPSGNSGILESVSTGDVSVVVKTLGVHTRLDGSDIFYKCYPK